MRKKADIEIAKRKLEAFIKKYQKDRNRMAPFHRAEMMSRAADAKLQIEVMDWILGISEEEPHAGPRACNV